MSGSEMFEPFGERLGVTGAWVWTINLVLFEIFVPCTPRLGNTKIYIKKVTFLGVIRTFHFI